MPTQHRPLCLVFDDGAKAESVQRSLSQLGYGVTVAPSAEATLRELARRDHTIAFVAAHDAATLELISSMLAACPELAIVAIIASGDTKTALEAGKRGAADCVVTPIAQDQLEDTLRRLETQAQKSEVSKEEASWPESSAPALRTAVSLLKQAASSDVPVLVRGERGTGRRALARLLHARGSRCNGPFVAIDCTPDEPAKLFGAPVNGSGSRAPGLVETAHGGSLLLDEVGELSLDLQAALLDFMEQTGESTRPDVRVVALTRHDLGDRVAAGHFRADLYDRLRAFSVHLPALRERREDILLLSRNLIATYAARAGRAAPELSPATEALLLGHDWEGNMRELGGELERALALCPGHVLEPAAFSERLRPRPRAPYLGGDFTLEQIEREHIERVLTRSRTFDEAAHLLGIDDSTLWRKRKRFAVSHAA